MINFLGSIPMSSRSTYLYTVIVLSQLKEVPLDRDFVSLTVKLLGTRSQSVIRLYKLFVRNS